jgi:hypothetical protein
MSPSTKLKPFRDEITHFFVQDRASVADIERFLLAKVSILKEPS